MHPEPDRSDAPTPETMQFCWIESGDARLAASIDLPGSAPPWPVVVIVHGFSGDRIGRSYHFVEFGRRLNALGIACARFDHAGCGESTGDQRAYSMGTVERDCLDVAEYLARDGRFDMGRLGVVGSSLGALGGTMLASRFHARGLLLWAPVCDLPGITAEAAPAEVVQRSLEQVGFAPFKGLRIGPTYFDHLGHLDPAQHVPSLTAPVFIAHARDDRAVPIDHARRYVQLCRDHDIECEFMEFEGSTHDFHEEPARSRLLQASLERMGKWLCAPQR